MSEERIVKECPKCKSSDLIFVKQTRLFNCQTCSSLFNVKGAIFIPKEEVFNKMAHMSHEGVLKVMKDHKITPADAAMMQATVFELITDAYQNGFREGLLIGTKQNMYNLIKETKDG